MTSPFSHLDESGAAHMVDVAGKDVTVRTATAEGRVDLSPECVALLRGEGVPKGDALAVARLAGIMGAKRTPELVPLCHPIAVHGVVVDLVVDDDGVAVTATVRTADRIIVLSGGRIAAEGAPAAVITEELLARHFRIRARIEHAEEGVVVVPIAPIDPPQS